VNTAFRPGAPKGVAAVVLRDVATSSQFALRFSPIQGSRRRLTAEASSRPPLQEARAAGRRAFVADNERVFGGDGRLRSATRFREARR
jgi:hypothetical protein